MAPSYGSAVLPELGVVIEELILELTQFGVDCWVGDLERNEGVWPRCLRFHGGRIPLGHSPFLNGEVINSIKLDWKDNAHSHV